MFFYCLLSIDKFKCKGCSNNCEIIKVMKDKKIIDAWGNRCPKGELVHK